jgi:transketolase
MQSNTQSSNDQQSQRMANAIRMLAVDAVQAANSGHPGAPMGMADIAQVLWNKHLKHNPSNPGWPNRDRFVLSNGHGSMLIYALLHLTGYDLSLQELKRFRQLHSKTPGHPEVDVTPGIETTTGPLGQGLANAVGMALAERLLALEFNEPGHPIIDHLTYAFVGDGCLMEGLSHEACSLAGTLGLSKLIVFYDDNGISIDGHVADWFSDDTPRRFEAYGWSVISNIDGHDCKAVDRAIEQAREQALKPNGKPTLICCKTVIGLGSPNKAGTHDVHGAALGEQEVAATRLALDWPHEPFEVPQDIMAAWDGRARGAATEAEWQGRLQQYAQAYPQKAQALQRRLAGDYFDASFDEIVQRALEALDHERGSVASRKASQMALDQLAPQIPAIFGGSADLTGSNLTNFKGCVRVRPDATTGLQWGNHLSYGVREFGMAAIMNGMALHGGFIPYGGTFLTFSDYSRNAIRMAALMKLRVIHVLTHDSIGLGEDGPTHQSIEHIPSLRIIPNLQVWRPADAIETLVAWQCALQHVTGPSALCLSRQGLPALANASHAADLAKGGYVLQQTVGAPDVVLIGTGSELHLAVEAAKELAKDNIHARVVSMPCTNRFDAQSHRYQEEVLPDGVPAVAVEAAQPDGWYKYVGRHGRVVGIRTFGESAPAGHLFEHFGLTVQSVVQAARDVIGQAIERAVKS